MKSYPYVPSMVQAITVLTVLKMMTKAQTGGCGPGSMNGKIMYERLPNVQLQGFDDDIVKDSSPPFTVLEKCQDLCLNDRSSSNIRRMCTSFDFQPGSRRGTYNGETEYDESTCLLTAEQAQPEGLGTLIMVPNSIHFTEVCITSTRPDRECPNRRYIFERHPRKKLKLAAGDAKEMPASNRSECEDKCLNEFSFVCRSAVFDSAMHTCTLSRFTRRTQTLEDAHDSEYLENTCLNAERRCDGLAVFIKEENKRLNGPFEVDMFNNITLEDCQAMCVRAEKYFCRSIEYDEMTKQCTISEEDSFSQKDDISTSSSGTHHFYDFACLDSPRGSEYPDNSVTSHLFTGKRPDTAFQRYRNSRLGGEHHSEISGRSLSECLDECLRQPSFQCRSAEYSERFKTCRLTRYNQRDGMRIIYDADYDYYENLMLGGDNEGPGQRPSDGGGAGGVNGGGVYHPGDDRYPASGGGVGGGRYPPRYPPGRYPPSGGGSRYPPSTSGGGSRYPPSSTGGGRYPPSGGGRYPPSDGGRYPPSDRYPPPPRYPSGNGIDSGRYPPPPPVRYPYDSGDIYNTRYPTREPYPAPPTYDGGSSRYPLGPPLYEGGGKYDRYGPGGRYPYHPGISGYPGKYPDRRYPDDGYRGGSDSSHRYGGGNRYGDDRYEDRYGEGGRYSGNRYYYDRDADSRWLLRPDRRPPIRPYEERPGRPPPPYEDRPLRPYEVRPPYEERPPYDYRGNRRPISPGPDGPIYDNFGGPNRPFTSRCDEGENFKQIGSRQRIRKEFVRRFISTPSLTQCQRECADSRDFICRSFNYRDAVPPYEEENCELSDRDTRDLDVNSPQYFENTGNFDFYERDVSRQGVDGDCLDVSQVCNEDGMEFTLRTPEGFYGRIYTYGFYDRCFFRGNGGTINVLRISGAQGYPECGTQRYGDTLTNIVVVQFSDFVQTGKDKRFNLTCLFRGPGEAVVSSGFIGAGSGSPIPIEYLPAENTLSSKVRLMILYQGRPTTTIAVGDPLTFRLEAQDGYNYITDIFATNVIARDPYSGRSVQLIDRFGCPVDSYVFPELDRGRNGDSLEARFNAFKIPESNFLVFEATVRTCREGCQPAYCQTGTGRSEPSFGRRKRDVNATLSIDSNSTSIESEEVVNTTAISFAMNDEETNEISKDSEPPEYVREMIEVFESREELQQEARRAVPAPETVCLTTGEYHGLVSAVLVLVAILLTTSLIAGLAYRRYWSVMRKNLAVDRASSNLSSTYPNTRSSGLSSISIFGAGLQKPFPGFGRARNFPSLPKDDLECPMPSPGGPFEDPSEPIYTDPSLFERSRSLRSIAVSQKRRQSPSPQ